MGSAICCHQKLQEPEVQIHDYGAIGPYMGGFPSSGSYPTGHKDKTRFGQKSPSKSVWQRKNLWYFVGGDQWLKVLSDYRADKEFQCQMDMEEYKFVRMNCKSHSEDYALIFCGSDNPGIKPFPDWHKTKDMFSNVGASGGCVLCGNVDSWSYKEPGPKLYLNKARKKVASKARTGKDKIGIEDLLYLTSKRKTEAPPPTWFADENDHPIYEDMWKAVLKEFNQNHKDLVQVVHHCWVPHTEHKHARVMFFTHRRCQTDNLRLLNEALNKKSVTQQDKKGLTDQNLKLPRCFFCKHWENMTRPLLQPIAMPGTKGHKGHAPQGGGQDWTMRHCYSKYY